MDTASQAFANSLVSSGENRIDKNLLLEGL